MVANPAEVVKMWGSGPRSARGIAVRSVIGLTTAAIVAATGSHFVMPDVQHAAAYRIENTAAIDESSTTVGVADSNIYSRAPSRTSRSGST